MQRDCNNISIWPYLINIIKDEDEVANTYLWGGIVVDNI